MSEICPVERKRGPVWYAKYRLPQPDGTTRQVQKLLGPAWTQRGRPQAGYFTKRTAQAWPDETLVQARPGQAGRASGSREDGSDIRAGRDEWPG